MSEIRNYLVANPIHNITLPGTFVRIGAHHHQYIPPHSVYHDHLRFVHPLLELQLLVRFQLLGQIVVLVERQDLQVAVLQLSHVLDRQHGFPQTVEQLSDPVYRASHRGMIPQQGGASFP